VECEKSSGLLNQLWTRFTEYFPVLAERRNKAGRGRFSGGGGEHTDARHRLRRRFLMLEPKVILAGDERQEG